MDPRLRQLHGETRRQFLQDCPLKLGAIAASFLGGSSSLIGKAAVDGFASQNPLAPKRPAHPPRAKNVIYLHMSGSPPQHDLFDHKPKLQELHGTKCPREFFEGKRLAFTRGHPTLLGSPYPFRQVGGNGLWVTEKMPHFEQVIDKTTIIRSMTTDQFNHAPAQLLLYTGSAQFGAASMGSWVTYGLGSEAQDLPGYVVLISGGSDPSGGKSLWSSGFLPSVYQGVQCRSRGEPIFFVSNPDGMDRDVRRRSLDALRDLNEVTYEQDRDPETLARIDQYELAYRMQLTVPEVMDIRREPQSVHEMYGTQPGETSFANHCLLARRLVESGVRFVQLFDWGWDIHGTGSHDDLLTQFPKKCLDVDRPIAALLLDLEQRGLLDETLVVWGGEFGRTSMNEARGGSTYLGRDHHPDCFTIWMAGGGVKRGYIHGETDELGYTIADGKVHVHDLQATILHLLGLDPFRLRYQTQGLDQRLIGVEEGPRVLTEILS